MTDVLKSRIDALVTTVLKRLQEWGVEATPT